jgi:hypothetical protein
VAGGAPGAGGAAAAGSGRASSGLSMRECWPSPWADSLRAWVTRPAGEKGWAADADARQGGLRPPARPTHRVAPPWPEAGRSLRGLSRRSAWGRGAQQSEQMEEGRSDFAGEGEKGCLSGRRRARLGGVRRPLTCGDREQGRRGRGVGREGGPEEVKKEKERV